MMVSSLTPIWVTRPQWVNAYTKFQIDISKHGKKKSPENSDGRTDGQTDGHCHSIIRPFFKRAYKRGLKDFHYFFQDGLYMDQLVTGNILAVFRITIWIQCYFSWYSRFIYFFISSVSNIMETHIWVDSKGAWSWSSNIYDVFSLERPLLGSFLFLKLCIRRCAPSECFLFVFLYLLIL